MITRLDWFCHGCVCRNTFSGDCVPLPGWSVPFQKPPGGWSGAGSHVR